jgi:hypothetical protein
VLPNDLAKAAESKGLSPVEGFYDRPGMVEAPFVYGYLPGEKENSAAFWVKSKQEGEFLLVIETKTAVPPEYSCPNTLPWKNFPGGLSIVRNGNMSLGDFVYASDPSRKGPAETNITHNAITSYYDGVEIIFYCFNGNWLIRQRH